MSNNTTKIIKFKAQFEEAKGFGKWINDIEKDIDKSVENSFNQWIREYKAKLDALTKTLNQAGPNPSDNVIASMYKEMKGMLDLSKKIANQFSKMSLGAASSQIEQAAATVQRRSKERRNAQSNARNWRSKLSIDEKHLSDAELKRIYDRGASKGSSFNGKVLGGENGMDLQAFVREAKKDIATLRSLNDDVAKAIVNRFAEINANIEHYGLEAEKKAEELKQAKEAFQSAATAATGTSTGGLDTKAIAGQEQVNRFAIASDETSEAIKAYAEETKAKTEATNATESYNKENQKTPNIVAKAAKQVFAYGTVVSLFKKVLQGAKKTIIELDGAFTDMAVVTNLTRQEAWNMVDDFQAIAKETGSVTSEVAATTTKFLQQGKTLTQATQLSEAALKAAKIAGIEASRSVDLLTNAMNGFQMSASQALEVSDKFAALAAASATDYEELAVALSKVAAQANLAGMSMDFTLGMLAKGIEVTREAPETIGTALKTVISRMRELSDFGETLEEGMDVNRVETALKNVGVQLRDSNGQFRNLEDVLSELGAVWGELNTNQQANVAVALAGTRQQSRLIAMMQDFDRTMELVDISTNSYGATMAQHIEYMGSMQAATDGLRTSYEGLVSGLANADAIIGIIDTISRVVEVFDWILNDARMLVPLLTIMGVMSLNALGNKIQEYQYNRMNLQIEQTEAQIERQKWLEEHKFLDKKNKQQAIEALARAKEKVDAAVMAKNRAKEILDEKIKTKEDLKQTKELKKQMVLGNNSLSDQQKEAALQKINAEYAADELAIQNEITKASQDFEQAELNATAAQQEFQSIQSQINASDAERLHYMQMQSLEATSQMQSFGIIGNLMNAIVAPLQMAASIMGIINTLSTIFIGLKKKEGQETDKNTRKTLQQAMAEKVKAAWGMAGSAASIPVAGWVIAGVILATILGLAIAGAVATANAQNKSRDSVEGNIQAMQELQAEIYNLGQSINTISALSEEFETLSAKINKTAEDTQRLNEIMTEFNDLVGYEMLDNSMSYDEVLSKIRAHEASLTIDLEKKVQESNKTLKTATKTAAELKKYIESAEGRAIIQQNLSQNYSEFGNASETTKSTILDIIKNNPSSFIGAGGGLNYKAIQSAFSSADIALMDAAVVSGTLSEYKSVLNQLSAAARQYLSTSKSLFGEIGKMSDGIVQSIDGLGLTADQLTKLSPMLLKNKSLIEQAILNNGGTLSKEKLMSLLYENRGSSETAKFDLEAAQAARKAYGATADYAEYERLSSKISKDGIGSLSASERESYDRISAYLATLQTAIEDAEFAVEMSEMSRQEWWNTFGNIPGINDLQNIADKVNSSIGKMSQAFAGELSGAELDELLNNYPVLIDYLHDGVVTAEEFKQARDAIFEAEAENMKQALTDVDSQNKDIFADLGLNWNIFKTMNEEDLQRALQSAGLSDKDFNTAVAAWRNYALYEKKIGDFVASGGMTEEERQRIAESTGIKLAQAQYGAYKEQLQHYVNTDPEYEKLFGLSYSAASAAASQAAKEKNEIRQTIQKILGEYDFEIINGDIYFKNKNGVIQSLSTLPLDIQRTFSAVPEALLEAFAKAEDVENDYAKSMAEDYINIKTEQLEKEKELLEEKKQAYQDYYDKMDALEEQSERIANKEDIIKQIAALSGGIDGASKSRIKELQQQLSDLEKEEEEARKEEMRNAILDNLDDQAEDLDKDIKKLDESVGLLIRTILANATGKQFEYKVGDETAVEQLETWLASIGIKPFASGGLVDYTGLAAVHGSSLRPESFLDADDTALLSEVLNILNAHLDGVSNTTSYVTEENSSSITIENVNITTTQLNNKQDFKESARAFASELLRQTNARGVNINVKK